MAIPRNLANIAPHVNASSTELVVNDGGADLDFRVEGDTVSQTCCLWMQVQKRLGLAQQLKPIQN
jgi:hypothetical protein